MKRFPNISFEEAKHMSPNDIDILIKLDEIIIEETNKRIEREKTKAKKIRR